MKNNKRKAQFGNSAVLNNSRMIDRSQKLRLGSVVEIRPDAYFDSWVRGQIIGKRGVVVKLNDIGWETDISGKRHVVGGWDAVVEFSNAKSHRKIYGLDKHKMVVISPRQLRDERRSRNEEKFNELFGIDRRASRSV